MLTEQQPLYQRIVDDITKRLSSREFRPGDKMYSVSECRQYYDVSSTTAVRALEALKERKLIHSVKGKGSFFRTLPTDSETAVSTAPLTKLIIASDAINFFKTGFQSPICEGIEAEAVQRQLTTQLLPIPAVDVSRREMLPLTLEANEGIIMISGNLTSVTLGLSRMRAVFVDMVLPGVSCVASDNLDGMRQLVDHLVELGHRHLLLASHDPQRANPTNENERATAFRFLTADRNVSGESTQADMHAHIIERVRAADGPTAIVFTQDDPALEFIATAKSAGLRVPEDISVTGFDGYRVNAEDTTSLTTLTVDRNQLGRAAVEALQKQGLAACPSWERVRGRLTVGASTGTAPR